MKDRWTPLPEWDTELEFIVIQINSSHIKEISNKVLSKEKGCSNWQMELLSMVHFKEESLLDNRRYFMLMDLPIKDSSSMDKRMDMGYLSLVWKAMKDSTAIIKDMVKEL